MNKYRLGNVNLVIHQGLNASHQLDFSQIKASILEDVFSKNKADTITPGAVRKSPVMNSTVVMEMKILYPTIKTSEVTKL